MTTDDNAYLKTYYACCDATEDKTRNAIDQFTWSIVRQHIWFDNFDATYDTIWEALNDSNWESLVEEIR